MAKKGRLVQFLVDQDIYGHKIGVHYRGSDTFKTKFGAIVSVVTYVFIAINLQSLLFAFKDGTKQDEKNQSILVDRYFEDAHSFEENDLQLTVYIEKEIPKEYGRIKIS